MKKEKAPKVKKVKEPKVKKVKAPKVKKVKEPKVKKVKAPKVKKVKAPKVKKQRVAKAVHPALAWILILLALVAAFVVGAIVCLENPVADITAWIQNLI